MLDADPSISAACTDPPAGITAINLGMLALLAAFKRSARRTTGSPEALSAGSSHAGDARPSMGTDGELLLTSELEALTRNGY